MSKRLIVSLAILGIFAFVGLSIGGWILGSYNQLVTENQVVDTSWSKVETQYQRRFDLIPNLVNATKGFLAQEQKVFGDIAEARTRYTGAPAGSNDKVEATNQYESAIARLLVVMENYPVLKSNETIKALTDELAGTENRVAVERNRYNDEVQVWNVMIKVFPKNIIAGMFGFHERTRFESAKGADIVPEVNLLIN